MSHEIRRYMDAVRTICEGAAAWHPTEREIGVFMYGGCAALALAIQKLTGLPLVALVEPDGETERAVHAMAKLADGRYLDVNGARTYAEILADCRDEHECTTGGWSLVSASPRYLKLCIQDGIFDPISPALAAGAHKVAARLVAAYGLQRTTLGEGAAEVIPAKAMVTAFYAKFDKSKLKGAVSVSLEVKGDTDVELEYIGTDSQYRRKGLASKTMTVLIRLADQYRVTLTLYVDPDAGADEDSPEAEQLAEWYAGFGFEEQDYWTHLVRQPVLHNRR